MSTSLIRLGTDVRTDEVVAIARNQFGNGHMHIRGRTRSGKTAMSILSLAIQLMVEYEEESERKRDPLFVFDLGGDQALFWHIRAAAINAGRTFQFLSLDQSDDWSYFDPFQAVHGERNVIRLANLFIEAFNLDNGLVYGGQYFTQQNLAALLQVARRLLKAKGEYPTLLEIRDYLDSANTKRRIRDADQIRMTFDFLLEYEQLQPETAEDSNADKIDVSSVIENGQVAYFYTPTMNEATTARQIAGLGLYSVISAAMERARAGKPRKRIWVLIDEFHELAGRSFAALLAQCGKFGISLIMANQTTTQLENRDSSLAQVVLDNCHVKQYFTVTSVRDIEDLQAFSKDRKVTLGGKSMRPGLSRDSTSEREVILPKLSKNKILDTSATRGHSFLIIDDGEGHKEPRRVKGRFVTNEKDYLRSSITRLPQSARQKGVHSNAAAKNARKAAAPGRTIDRERLLMLENLLKRKQDEERVH